MKQLACSAWHLARGGRFGPFAGWELPLQYAGQSVLDSVLHTRRHASLFDVSHMHQMEVSGEQAVQQLSRLVPVDLKGLPLNRSRLCLYLNYDGGIIDDAIISRIDDKKFRIVSNASRADRLMEHVMKEGMERSDIRIIEDEVLLALQGPDSGNVLSATGLDAASLKFMSMYMEAGMLLGRSGYTGEDGFEISIPAGKAESIMNELVSHDSVRPAGIIARDILRIEAGLLLNGQDMDESTGPAEVGLSWTVASTRLAMGDFIGATKLGDKGRRLLGLMAADPGGPPPRSGVVLFKEDSLIGEVTSGCFSPTLQRNICYGKMSSNIPYDTTIHAMIRGIKYAYRSVKLPFLPHQYVKKLV